MDDDSADSKLSKLAPPADELQELPEDEWYQPGSGGG